MRDTEIRVRVTSQELRDFKRLAEDEDTTMSALLRQAMQAMAVQSTVSDWD